MYIKLLIKSLNIISAYEKETIGQNSSYHSLLPRYERFCCLSTCNLWCLGIISVAFEPEISSGWQLERTSQFYLFYSGLPQAKHFHIDKTPLYKIYYTKLCLASFVNRKKKKKKGFCQRQEEENSSLNGKRILYPMTGKNNHACIT